MFRRDVVMAKLDPELRWVGDFFPRPLGSGWKLERVTADGTAWSLGTFDPLTVITSGAVELDGKRWLHVSLARPTRLPSYSDMTMVKDLFIGPQATALQVFAPRSRHVNLHQCCLHLWHCADGDVTPDFARGGASI